MSRWFVAVTLLALGHAGAAQVPAESRDAKFADVRFEQRIGAQLPLATRFVDVNNRTRTLGLVLDDKPAVLAFSWYGCSHMCSLLLDNLAAALSGVSHRAGRDYQLVVIGIDPDEGYQDAARRRADLVRKAGLPEAEDAWHFLTGGADAIRSVANAGGFHYEWDPVSEQFAHPVGVALVTPRGVLSSYLPGITFAQAKLEQAINEAGRGELGRIVDALLLYCFGVDPASGRYTPTVLNTLRLVAVVFVMVLLGFGIAWYRRQDTEPRT